MCSPNPLLLCFYPLRKTSWSTHNSADSELLGVLSAASAVTCDTGDPSGSVRASLVLTRVSPLRNQDPIGGRERKRDSPSLYSPSSPVPPVTRQLKHSGVTSSGFMKHHAVLCSERRAPAQHALAGFCGIHWFLAATIGRVRYQKQTILQMYFWLKIFFFMSSHCGSAETNLTSIHEETGSIPGLAQRIEDPACCELWYRSQMWFRSRVAVAVA